MRGTKTAPGAAYEAKDDPEPADETSVQKDRRVDDDDPQLPFGGVLGELGELPTSSATDLDNLLLDASAVGRERDLRLKVGNLAFVQVAGEPHPMGSTRLRRYLFYYLGIFGPVWKETAHVQPSNQLLKGLCAFWYQPVVLFYTMFGITMVNQMLAQPNSEGQAKHWTWRLGTALIALVVPPILIFVPLTFITMHSLAAVPRETLREFIAKHNTALSMVHACGITTFEISLLGIMLRLASAYVVNDSNFAYVYVICWMLGIMVALAASWPIVQMFLDSWRPWEEVRRELRRASSSKRTKVHVSTMGSKKLSKNLRQAVHELRRASSIKRKGSSSTTSASRRKDSAGSSGSGSA